MAVIIILLMLVGTCISAYVLIGLPLMFIGPTIDSRTALIVLLLALAALCVSTITLESIPVLFVKNKRSWWKASLICNVVTNPILNVVIFLLTAILQSNDVIYPVILVLECAVVLIEAYFYQRMLNSRFTACLVFSLIANLLSFSAGMFLYAF